MHKKVSAKRILAILGALGVAGYVYVEVTSTLRTKESFDQANAFCNKATGGVAVGEIVALAREHVAKKYLSVDSDGLFMLFNGGCYCRLGFKDGKAYPATVICNS